LSQHRVWKSFAIRAGLAIDQVFRSPNLSKVGAAARNARCEADNFNSDKPEGSRRGAVVTPAAREMLLCWCTSRHFHVCFCSISRHSSVRLQCPKCAKSRRNAERHRPSNEMLWCYAEPATATKPGIVNAGRRFPDGSPHTRREAALGARNRCCGSPNRRQTDKGV
jgi:hypothetical protein